jgi:ribonuclease HII
MIVGVDEVGRGCWAGPVCVGVVILDDNAPIAGLDDSKKLTAKTRELLALQIKRNAQYVSLGWASPQVIDSHGLTFALRVAALRALQPLEAIATEVLLDGSFNYIKDPRVTTIVGGDGSVPAISAASIVAKVARDSYMQALALRFPGYGFERHVGYGTAVHKAALTELGASIFHRMSFAPLARLSVDN